MIDDEVGCHSKLSTGMSFQVKRVICSYQMQYLDIKLPVGPATSDANTPDAFYQQSALVLFAQLLAAVAHHNANNSVICAIKAWFKYVTARAGVVSSYYVVAYQLQQCCNLCVPE